MDITNGLQLWSISLKEENKHLEENSLVGFPDHDIWKKSGKY